MSSGRSTHAARRRERRRGVVRGVWCGLVVAFALAPAIVVAIASFSDTAFVTFPPEGWSLRWYRALLDNQDFIDSFRFSATLALVTAILATAIGFFVAYAIVHRDFWGKSALESFFFAPVAIPGVVLGLGLLQLFSSAGIRPSLWTLLLGHLLVTVPFAIRIVGASLVSLDRDLPKAARSLGCSPVRALLIVTLPLIRVGLFGSLIFCAILSFDEVALSIFLSGVEATPLSVRLYSYTEQTTTPLINAASTVLILIGLVSLAVIDRTIGIERAFAARS